jgi:acyl-CoA thioesterase FadM
VFGFVLGVLAEAAFTGDLYIRYHAPTPLFRPLACRVRLAERDGRKLHLTGELTDVESGQMVASATATFITVDREAFARRTAARPAPPDDGSSA